MGLLSPEAKAALASPVVHLAVLAELEFSTGVERYWSGYSPLDYEGETWVATGNFGKVDPIESSEDFHANGLKLTLGGLPGDVLRAVRVLKANEYKARPARFILAVMDETFQTVIHAIPRYYFMDILDYSYDAASGASVTMSLETEVRYGSRKSIRRHSDQDQKSEFPDDRAFEFVSYINSGVEVKWGTSGAFFK